jgi:hypothetical protein
MTGRRLKGLIAACLLAGAVAVALAGCANPDAPGAGQRTKPGAGVQNAGEPPAPPPAAPTAQSPADVQPTPAMALALFAGLYVNWSYRTITSRQQTLAAISVGGARLSEQQAAAASRADTTISRGRIWNHGQIVSIAPDIVQPGAWVIVTREQTGGDSDYEGLPAAYHVTLAQLAQVPRGWAVRQWLPQS